MQLTKRLGSMLLMFGLLASLSACGNSDSGSLMDGNSPAFASSNDAILVLAASDDSAEALVNWGAAMERARGAAVEVGFTGLDQAAEQRGLQSALGAALALSALRPRHVTVLQALAYGGGSQARRLKQSGEIPEALAVLDAPHTMIEAFGCHGFMQAYLRKRAIRLCADKKIILAASVLIVPVDEALVAPAATEELKKTFRDVRFVTSERLLWLSLSTRAGRGGRKLVIPYLTTPAQLKRFGLKACAVLPGVLVDTATILDDPLSFEVTDLAR